MQDKDSSRDSLALGLAAPPSQALGRLGGASDLLNFGKKAAEANKEITEAEEIELGEGIAARLLGAAPLVDDEGLQRYVNRVGLWLALQTERPGLPWRFGVMDSDNVNAFALPGGIVLITRGLYERLRHGFVDLPQPGPGRFQLRAGEVDLDQGLVEGYGARGRRHDGTGQTEEQGQGQRAHASWLALTSAIRYIKLSYSRSGRENPVPRARSLTARMRAVSAAPGAAGSSHRPG